MPNAMVGFMIAVGADGLVRCDDAFPLASDITFRFLKKGANTTYIPGHVLTYWLYLISLDDLGSSGCGDFAYFGFVIYCDSHDGSPPNFFHVSVVLLESPASDPFTSSGVTSGVGAISCDDIVAGSGVFLDSSGFDFTFDDSICGCDCSASSPDPDICSGRVNATPEDV
jgi:hypothetical protein